MSSILKTIGPVENKNNNLNKTAKEDAEDIEEVAQEDAENEETHETTETTNDAKDDDYLDEGVVKTLMTITSKTPANGKKKTFHIKPSKSNFTDPNIYLKLDPIKSIHSNIAKSINYEHVIITRFSYRFTNRMPIGNLFDSDRLKRRFELFETFCLPSVLSQINPNFYWVIVVDPELPTNYLDTLYRHVAKFYASSLYATRGPRQIFIYRWTYNTTLAHIEWLNSLIPLNRKYFITTRLDDDDCISRDFTNLVAEHLRTSTSTSTIKGFKLISFSCGYYWYNQPSLTYGIFKPTNRPWIAIGLSMITEREKYPMTVYFGNHTKLTQYIRNWKNHSMLRTFIEAAKEEYDAKDVAEKYEVIRKKQPVYVRSVHDHNLQKNERNEYLDKTVDLKGGSGSVKDDIINGVNGSLKRASVHNLTIINQYFTINQSCLEKINANIQSDST